MSKTREVLVYYVPTLAFYAEVEEGKDFDAAEYFLDCIHTWVSETAPEGINGNVKVMDENKDRPIVHEPINTVGELIRFLALWCPDTPVEVAPRDTGESMDITHHTYEGDILTLLVEH